MWEREEQLTQVANGSIKFTMKIADPTPMFLHNSMRRSSTPATRGTFRCGTNRNVALRARSPQREEVVRAGYFAAHRFAAFPGRYLLWQFEHDCANTSDAMSMLSWFLVRAAL